MTTDTASGPSLLGGRPLSWDFGRIAALREQCGWTQEELAERSGLSVRTIRNLELGRVQNPRRSSIDLLANALGVDREPQRGTAVGHDRMPWRGPQPPGSALVGSRSEYDRLVQTVRANRLTTFVGPGGVGKTRLALSIATDIGHVFRHGVAVVELGDLPPERHGPLGQAAAVRQRLQPYLNRDRGPGSSDGADADGQRQTNLLLVLDNAEHVPDSVTAVTRQLLGTSAGIHVLITSRRRLTERLGVNREIRPLRVDAEPGQPLSTAPAVELMLRHVGADSWAAADLARELPLIADLCGRLGGSPRFLEFAGEHLRTIPVTLLLKHGGPTMQMLRTRDHALLHHQRSLADSLRWDLDLLTDDHRWLLGRIIASFPARRFTAGDVLAEENPGRATAMANPLTLLSDLLEASLIVADPDDRYRYQLAPYVAEVAGHLTPDGVELADDRPAVGF